MKDRCVKFIVKFSFKLKNLDSRNILCNFNVQ